jgi:hypothetical protein
LISLWYLASLTDLGHKSLKKAKVLVRDYLRSRNGDSRMRAKIAWDKAIMSIVLGGLKI